MKTNHYLYNISEMKTNETKRLNLGSISRKLENQLVLCLSWIMSIIDKLQENVENLKKKVNREYRSIVQYFVDKALSGNDQGASYLKKKHIEPKIQSRLELFFGAECKDLVKDILEDYRNEAIYRKNVPNEFINNVGEYLVLRLREEAKKIC